MANRTHLLQIRLTAQELKEIRALADAKGLSMSAYLRSMAKQQYELAKNKPK